MNTIIGFLIFTLWVLGYLKAMKRKLSNQFIRVYFSMTVWFWQWFLAKRSFEPMLAYCWFGSLGDTFPWKLNNDSTTIIIQIWISKCCLLNGCHLGLTSMCYMDGITSTVLLRYNSHQVSYIVLTTYPPTFIDTFVGKNETYIDQANNIKIIRTCQIQRPSD